MSNSKFAAAAKIDPDPYQGGFIVGLLNHTDIPAFLALQNVVLATLADDQKHHLKQRTAEDLRDHLKAGMPLIGIKTIDGRLVAQALISLPTNDAAKNIEGYPIHGEEHITAIVQSVAVHPMFRGKVYGLAKMLHESIIDAAQQFGSYKLCAKISDTNPASQNSFLQNGFTRAVDGFDPKKGYPVGYFKKSLEIDHLMCGAASATLVLVR